MRDKLLRKKFNQEVINMDMKVPVMMILAVFLLLLMMYAPFPPEFETIGRMFLLFTVLGDGLLMVTYILEGRKR
jgi:hypothetical protein